jgi:hypothetical protein
MQHKAQFIIGLWPIKTVHYVPQVGRVDTACWTVALTIREAMVIKILLRIDATMSRILPR